MTTPAIHQFRGCELRIFPADEYVETVFWPDGATAGATRDSSEMGNVSYARHLGYRDCFEALVSHEACHTFVSEQMGHPYSPTLYAVARQYAPGTVPYEARLYEEAVVLSFERWANLREWAPVLDHTDIRFRLPRWLKQWEVLRGELMEKARAA